jgi:hypothetical protein
MGWIDRVKDWPASALEILHIEAAAATLATASSHI